MQRRGFVFSCLSAVAGLFGVRGKPELWRQARKPDGTRYIDFGYSPPGSACRGWGGENGELLMMVHKSRLRPPFAGEDAVVVEFTREEFEKFALKAMDVMATYENRQNGGGDALDIRVEA